MQPPRRPPPPTRRERAPAPPPKKNNLPLILGLSGGGLVLLIIIIAVASSGSSTPPPPAVVQKPKPVEPPKRFVPDVSAFESEGKLKCNDGMRLVQSSLRSGTPAQREAFRNDLEKGLRLLKEGLGAYKKASEIAGKTYPLSEVERVREQGIKAYCTDLERDGQAACDQGLKIIQSCEAKMTNSALGDDDKKALREDLQKGIKLITEGMNLFDRSHEVSEHTFDTNKYGQALKMARGKVLELK